MQVGIVLVEENCSTTDVVTIKVYKSLNANLFYRNLTELTNRIYCNSEHAALMNRMLVMMTPIGWKEFYTKA